MSALSLVSDLAPTALAVLGTAFLLKTVTVPWFASRRATRGARWAPAAALVAVPLALLAAVAAAWLPSALPWRASAVAWHALAFATAGLAIAIAVGVARQGRRGAWPRAQQVLAIAWGVLVPLTWQWDHWTRHHHRAPEAAHDVRASQLRPLTPAELGARAPTDRPAAGQCRLQVGVPGTAMPVLLATYGRGTGSAQDRLGAPTVWRDHGATLVGFGDGSLGLQDNTGLVRRTGLGWQLDVPSAWTWDQVQAAHDAHRAETARRAERAAREAAWRQVDQLRALLATTPPDANAEVPLRLQPDSSFDRFESPVVRQALAAAGMRCERASASRTGWQCTGPGDAGTCPVVYLSDLCPTVSRRTAGEVLNLQAGVAPAATGSDTAWFLFRARPAACVLFSRRIGDAAVRAARGPAQVTCDPSPSDPERPVPVLTADLAYPSESERSRLDDRARDLRAAYDDALRAVPPPEVVPQPRRLHALTDGETACDATTGPCRRFDAHLVADGSPLVIEERCSDATTAAAQSRFADPYFKR